MSAKRLIETMLPYPKYVSQACHFHSNFNAVTLVFFDLMLSIESFRTRLSHAVAQWSNSNYLLLLITYLLSYYLDSIVWSDDLIWSNQRWAVGWISVTLSVSIWVSYRSLKSFVSLFKFFWPLPEAPVNSSQLAASCQLPVPTAAPSSPSKQIWVLGPWSFFF